MYKLKENMLSFKKYFYFQIVLKNTTVLNKFSNLYLEVNIN